MLFKNLSNCKKLLFESFACNLNLFNKVITLNRRYFCTINDEALYKTFGILVVHAWCQFNFGGFPNYVQRTKECKPSLTFSMKQLYAFF